MRFKLIIFAFSFCITQIAISQTEFIYSSEGKQILNRRDMIYNCLHSMHSERANKSALAICECQINKLNYAFTNKQYRSVTVNRVVDVSKLIKLDTALENAMEQCYKSSNQTILISAQGFGEQMIENCKESILKASKDADKNKVAGFCSCKLEFIKNKKITDVEMEDLNDPNSILFYQVMSTCGDPFADDNFISQWTQTSAKDINGPESDTVNLLSLNGMHYIKLKVGSVIYFWLLDTGASDMLITKEVEQKLKDEKILSANNYLGIGKYEMANGEMDTCRKYKIENIFIGKYSVGNLVVAVSDKAHRVIAGKSILNKFSNWMIDNKQNTLLLNK